MRMFRTTAILMCLVVSYPAYAFEDEVFCESVKQVATLVNKLDGSMIDKITRLDEMNVLCGTKTVEYKKTLLSNSDGFGSNWREREQSGWNDMYCKDRAWRPAVESGWSVVNDYASPNGRHERFIAKCAP